MHEGLGRPQVEELRQLRSRVAKLEHNDTRRKDIEEAYRLLVDHSLQGLMLLQDERVVFANQAAADVTGYGTDELLTITLEQFITFTHPEDRPMVRQRYMDRLQGLPVPARYEFRATHRDGSLHWLEIHARVVEYRGRPATQIALTDVTARKRTELALYESESRLKSIFRAAPVGIGLVSNRVLLKVNDRICEMVGYPREELIGQNARMLYPTQEDYDYVGREKYEQIQERGTGAVETRWLRKDGEVIDVLLGSTPLDPKDSSKGVTFTALDITERKRTEDALRENRAELQTILDSSPCAIVVSDLEGRVVDANTVSLKMFGVHSKEEGIGRSVLEFASPGDRDRARDNLARTLADGPLRNVEYVLLRSDGSEFIGEISSSVIRDADGDPAGLVTVASDITERKRSEALTRILHDLAVSLGAVGSLEEGLRLCLQAALDASGLDCGVIYLRDEPSGGLDMSCHMGLSDDFVARVSHYDRETANTQLVMTGRPVYTTFEELGVPLDETKLREGLRAITVIPILHRSQVIACLNVASHSLAEVPPCSRTVLETIADQIGGTITRLKVEEEVRRERELLDRVANTSPAGITVLDREGRLKFANARAEEILGFAREQITQRTYNAPAWHITDYDGGPFPEEQLPFQQVMTTGQPVHNVRHAIEWPDGRRVLLSINAAPILDDTGQLEGVVATIDDVTEQVRAEHALRESEKHMRLVVEASPLPLHVTRPATGEILLANRATCELFGYNGQEILRTSPRDFYADPGKDRPGVLAELQERGRIVQRELAMRKSDGTVFPALISLEPIEYERRPATLVVVYDLTERKRMETALQTSERRFRAIIEQSGDVFSLVDAQGNTLYDSPSVKRWFGYEEKENLGRNIQDVIHPDDWPRVKVQFEHLWTHGNNATSELRLRHKDGSWRWIEATATNLMGDPNVGAVAIAYRDITNRKQAEEALRVSEERFRRVFEEGPVGMVLTSRDLGFCHANPAFCRMLGYEEEEMNGMTFLDVTHPEHRDADRQNVQRLWRGEIPCYKTEKRYLTKDGDIRWGSLSASLLQHREGKPLYALAIVEDITERKRSEDLMRIQHDLAVSLGAVGGLQEGLRLCLRAALDGSGLDCGAIYFRDEASGGLDMPCHVGLSDDFVARVSHLDREAVNTRIVMGGRPIYVMYEKLGVALDEAALREGLRAIAVIPILHRDQVIGCLNVASHSLAEVPPYSRSILETIASQIGGTIVRLKAEEALSESKQRMDLALQGADLGTWDWDVQTGHVAFNERWAQMLGYTLDEIEPHVSVWKKLIHPDDLAPVLEILNAHLEGRTDSYAAQHRLKHKSGDWVWVLDKGRVIDRNTDGKPLRACGTHLNITEQKRAENALRESEQKFHALFEQAPDAIYLSDLEGNLVDGNKAAEQLVGAPRDELIG